MYLWDSEEAARGFFSDELVERVTGLYGVRPTVTFVEVAELVDNRPGGRVTSRNPIEAVREIVERGVRLAKLELELKTTELKGKAARFGIGAGLGLVAVLLSPLLVIFLLATVAAALATVLKVWLAILIVTGILFVLVGGLAGAAVVLTRAAVKKGEDE